MMKFFKEITKGVISALVCASLIMTPVLAEGEVASDVNVTTKTEQEELVPPYPEDSHLSIEETYEIPADSNSLPSWPEGPWINAESAILMDMDTGAVLYAKNAYKEQYPASITKLMTVLTALEYAQDGDKVEFSKESVEFLEPGDACIGMRPGEIIDMKDAFYAILMASANEVSYAVGESIGKQYLGGGFDEFIARMNEKSREIGCLNSHWVNANGLHDELHYTTAYDMAVIASAIYREPVFNEIMEAFEYTIPPTNDEEESRTFQQNHKMTWENGMYYYENCKGGKTGYTDQAQTTLVTLADDGNMKLAAVLLYDRGGHAYDETRELFDYGYDNFSKVNVAELEKNEDIKFFVDENPTLTLPEGVTYDSLKKEITVPDKNINEARIKYTYDDNPMGTFTVKLTTEAFKKITGEEAPEVKAAEKKAQEEKAAKIAKIKRNILITVGVILGIILLILIIFLIRLYQYKKRKRLRALRARRRRQQRLAQERRKRKN